MIVLTVKNLKFYKSKMAAAAILKNRKIAISRPWFNRFWRNFARWSISDLLTVPTVKNLKFQKSKMAVAAILKNIKIAISQPQFDRFWRNLARRCSSTLLTAPTVKILKFSESKLAAAAIWKNRHISAAVQPILTKFGKMMHFEPLDRPDR